MASLVRSFSRKLRHTLPRIGDEKFVTGRAWIRIWRSLSTGTGDLSSPKTESPVVLKQRTVGVFWDLDNKPPKNVSPYKAATRLMEMAAGLGDVVDVVAYANHHAFSHVPTWVHEERKQRKMLDELEVRGLVKPEELYVCGVCGAKKKTRLELTKHFKSLHEREHKKRMNHLESLKGKKKQKERFWNKNVEKESKYKEAARSIILPKVGYGLMQDLRRAGVYVRTVEDKPQAADIALKERITKSIKKGVQCICLVSDDSDFTPMLKMAKERNLHTVVVGDLRVLSAHANTYFSWGEIASGIAEQKAKRETRQLMADFMGRLGEKLDTHRYRGFGFDDDDDDLNEDHSGSDSESELDEEENDWRRRRKERSLYSDEESQDFDYFSDDNSESDSEPGHLSNPRKMRGTAVESKFSTYVPGRVRGLSTERIVTSRDHLYDLISENDVRASLPKGSRGLPRRTKARSVYDILQEESRTVVSEESIPKEISYVSEDPPLKMETHQRVNAAESGKAETVTTIGQSFFQNSSNQGGPELEVDKKCSPNFRDREGHLNLDAEAKFDTEPSSSGVAAGRGRQKKKKLFVEDEEQDKQRTTKSKKSKNHFGGESNEPIPFFMSGFASESKADCDRINNWYFDFWRNEEVEYKGKRINKHKKK